MYGTGVHSLLTIHSTIFALGAALLGAIMVLTGMALGHRMSHRSSFAMSCTTIVATALYFGTVLNRIRETEAYPNSPREMMSFWIGYGIIIAILLVGFRISRFGTPPKRD